MPTKFSKIFRRKWRLICLISGVLVLGLLLPNIIQAQVGDALQTGANWLIGSILRLFLRVMSAAFAMIVAAFIAIVQYDFSDRATEAVDKTWQIVRDLSNLFFIIVLMAIAFSTMLKLEAYKWQRLLPKLLMVAILINFSKTIAFMILDIGQVLMMTFVRAFAHIAVDNITSGLMIDKIFKMGYEGGGYNMLSAWAAQVLMAFMMVVSTLVMLVITILLVVRIGMIWMLVAISPAAYILSILDATKKHASRWWSTFISLVFLGPMLAFFLWFAFLFMAYGLLPQASMNQMEDRVGSAGFANEQYLPSEVLTPGNTLRFILAIVILIVGTGMAIQSASFGGKLASGVWGGGGKMFDRWRARGGKLSDLPGISGITRRVQQARQAAGTKWDAEGKTGWWRTAVSKGRQGFGEKLVQREGAGWFGKTLGRSMQLSPLQRAMMMSSTYGRKQWGAARDYKDRKIDTDVKSKVLPLMQQAQNPEEAWTRVKGFFSDEDTQLEGHKKEKARLDKLTANDALTLGQAAITQEIGMAEQEIAEVNADFNKKYSLTGENADRDHLAEVVKDDAEIDKLLVETGIVKEGADPTKKRDEFIKEFTNGEETNKALDERKQDLEKELEDPAAVLKRGEDEIDEKKSQLQAEKEAYRRGDIFNTDEITARQEQLNKIAKREVQLLTEIERAAGTPQEAELKEELGKVHASLTDYGFKVDVDKITADVNNTTKDPKALAAAIVKAKELQTKVQDNNKFKSADMTLRNSGYRGFQNALEKYRKLEQRKTDKSITKGEEQKMKSIESVFKDVGMGDLSDKNYFERLKLITNADIQDVKIKDQNQAHYGAKQGKNEEEKKEYDKKTTKRTAEITDEQAILSEASSLDEVKREELKVQREAAEKAINASNEKITGYRTESEYLRRQAQRQSVREELSKIDTDDQYELIGYFKQAMKNQNKHLAVAIMEKLAQDTNFNDLLQEYKLPANLGGMQTFGRDQLMGQLKMNQQEAFATMKDISDILRRGGHWSMAYSHGTKNGRYVENTPETQHDEALAMMLKASPNQMFNNLNRLGFGWNDPETNEFKFSPHGFDYMMRNATAMGFALSRGQFNANLLKNLGSISEQLKNYPAFANAQTVPNSPLLLQMLLEKLPRENTLQMIDQHLRQFYETSSRR